jgi:replicative DNA helicase
MKLSAPVYRLKRKAKLLSREEHIPLHEALDRIAVKEGFTGWSLLAAKLSETAPAAKLYAQLQPGDLVLLGARPGHGKTLMSLELAVEAMKWGNRSVFFSLEYTERDCLAGFQVIGADLADFDGLFDFDGSNAIDADYIMRKLAMAPVGTFAVIDYLQLLDQRRESPELMVQIRTIQSFAKERGLIMLFISQVDRSYDPLKKPYPDLADVRLPNPLDLKLFDKACFLNDGEVHFDVAS